MSKDSRMKKEMVGVMKSTFCYLFTVLCVFMMSALPVLAESEEANSGSDLGDKLLGIAAFVIAIPIFILIRKSKTEEYFATSPGGILKAKFNSILFDFGISFVIGAVIAYLLLKILKVLLIIAIVVGGIIGVLLLLAKLLPANDNATNQNGANSVNGTVSQVPSAEPVVASGAYNSSVQSTNTNSSMIPQSVPYGNNGSNNANFTSSVTQGESIKAADRKLVPFGDNTIAKAEQEYVFAYNGNQVNKTSTIDEMINFIKSWSKLTGNTDIPDISEWECNPNYPDIPYKQWRFMDQNKNFALISSNVPAFINKNVYETYILELHVAGNDVKTNKSTSISKDASLLEAIKSANQYITDNYPGIKCEWENDMNQDGIMRGMLTEFSMGSDICRIIAEVRLKNEQVKNEE